MRWDEMRWDEMILIDLSSHVVHGHLKKKEYEQEVRVTELSFLIRCPLSWQTVRQSERRTDGQPDGNVETAAQKHWFCPFNILIFFVTTIAIFLPKCNLVLKWKEVKRNIFHVNFFILSNHLFFYIYHTSKPFIQFFPTTLPPTERIILVQIFLFSNIFINRVGFSEKNERMFSNKFYRNKTSFVIYKKSRNKKEKKWWKNNKKQKWI